MTAGKLVNQTVRRKEKPERVEGNIRELLRGRFMVLCERRKMFARLEIVGWQRLNDKLNPRSIAITKIINESVSTGKSVDTSVIMDDSNPGNRQTKKCEDEIIPVFSRDSTIHDII